MTPISVPRSGSSARANRQEQSGRILGTQAGTVEMARAAWQQPLVVVLARCVGRGWHYGGRLARRVGRGRRYCWRLARLVGSGRGCGGQSCGRRCGGKALPTRRARRCGSRRRKTSSGRSLWLTAVWRARLDHLSRPHDRLASVGRTTDWRVSVVRPAQSRANRLGR